MEAIRLRVYDLRKQRGIGQGELAAALEVTPQTISKWETGKTMPDISMLPQIASYFGVSIDQLLGTKPLAGDYIRSDSDQRGFWGAQTDYLRNVRLDMWNDDYLRFLVDSVWRIKTPVNLIDFGCGYGFMAEKLLPLLPGGSRYTGIDIDDTLLAQARAAFGEQHNIRFEQADLYEYQPGAKYDIAFSHAVLRHLNYPQRVLRKMADTVAPGGMVICCEVNRRYEAAGLMIGGMDYAALCESYMEDLWKQDLERQGRDYATGIKIPFYMQNLGLERIGTRMNDKVSFLHPGCKGYREKLDALVHANGWDRMLSEQELQGQVTTMMGRGLDFKQAQEHCCRRQRIAGYLRTTPEPSILKFYGITVSYGYKPQ